MKELEDKLSNIQLKMPSKNYITEANNIISQAKQAERWSINKWFLAASFGLSLCFNVFLFLGESKLNKPLIAKSDAQKYDSGYSIDYGISLTGIRTQNITKIWETEQ